MLLSSVKYFCTETLRFSHFCIRLIYCVIYETILGVSGTVRPQCKDLSQDVILVTGAGGGLGRLLCLEFAKFCPIILGLDINENELLETSRLVGQRNNIQIKTYLCDLRSKDAVDSISSLILQEYGRVTILVNNAGVVSGDMLLNLQPHMIEECFEVNVISHFRLIQKFLPSMLGILSSVSQVSNPMKSSLPRGHIVTIASFASLVPNAGLVDYCATKAAALSMASALELELYKMGIYDEICVTRVLPFLMNTKMFNGCRTSLPWLFPVLDTHECARRIVWAVRSNKRELHLPNYNKLFCLMYAVLPTKALHMMFDFAGSLGLVEQLQVARASVG